MKTAPMPVPQISVIIPAFNAVQYIGLQLEALQAQSGAPEFEVIVVDNNSSDGTAGLVRRYAADVTYPLLLVQAAEHQGPGYARNVGASQARADLLMFADADDVVSRWWLAHGLRAFQESQLWSGGSRLMHDHEMAGTLSEIRTLMEDSPEWTGVTRGDLREAFPVLMGGNFGATRSVYHRLGGFDQSLGGVYEDNDLAIRAHLAGLRVDDVPAAKIAFRGKWDIAFRTKLARRSAKAHAVVAARYGLRERSHFPNPLREVPRALGSAALMVVGRKEADWPGVWIRLNTTVGVVVGRLASHRSRHAMETQIGVGLAEHELREL